jgi:hypothetical protein
MPTGTHGWSFALPRYKFVLDSSEITIADPFVVCRRRGSAPLGRVCGHALIIRRSNVGILA